MVISITRKCDRGKNPFNTISKKELLLYLEPKIGKKLTNKNKTYLCNLWKSLQGDDNQNIKDNKLKNETIKSKKNNDNKINAIKIVKKTLKFRNNVNGTLENIKEVEKLDKNIFDVKLPQNYENYSNGLTYCVNRIMNPYNIWLPEEFDYFLKEKLGYINKKTEPDLKTDILPENIPKVDNNVLQIALRKGVIRKRGVKPTTDIYAKRYNKATIEKIPKIDVNEKLSKDDENYENKKNLIIWKLRVRKKLIEYIISCKKYL